MTVDDALVTLVGSEAPSGQLDRRLRPGLQPFAKGQLGRLCQGVVVGLVKQLGESGLSLPLRPFNRVPPLLSLLFPGLRVNLIVEIQNNVPGALVALFQTSSSHELDAPFRGKSARLSLIGAKLR